MQNCGASVGQDSDNSTSLFVCQTSGRAHDTNICRAVIYERQGTGRWKTTQMTTELVQIFQ